MNTIDRSEQKEPLYVKLIPAFFTITVIALVLGSVAYVVIDDAKHSPERHQKQFATRMEECRKAGLTPQIAFYGNDTPFVLSCGAGIQ